MQPCSLDYVSVNLSASVTHCLLCAGKLSQSDLDDRALEALKEYNPNDAILVLKEVANNNMDHVTNKSAYLCGQMKAFKNKNKAGATAQAKGPDPQKLQV